MDTVLIAEDDLMVADMLAEILADEGFEVIGIAQRVSEAIAIAQRHTPDLAVIDVQLLDGLGTELANELLHHKEEYYIQLAIKIL
jgi:DNA-binding response OmpR family regulator